MGRKSSLTLYSFSDRTEEYLQHNWRLRYDRFYESNRQYRQPPSITYHTSTTDHLVSETSRGLLFRDTHPHPYPQFIRYSTRHHTVTPLEKGYTQPGIWDEFVNFIDWNRVTSKTTLIQEVKRGVKKNEKMLCSKVVTLGTIDCIVCLKIMETI